MNKSRRTQKQLQAAERADSRALRSTKEQLNLLDQVFGKGKGAKKERAKLLARLSVETEVKHKKDKKDKKDKK